MEYEVQSVTHVKELKEENKRVQEDTFRIRKEYETIFAPQSRDETNCKCAYAPYLHASVNVNYFSSFEIHNKGSGSNLLEKMGYKEG